MQRRVTPMTHEQARSIGRPVIEVGRSYEFFCEVQQDYVPPRERLRQYTGQIVEVVAIENHPGDKDWDDEFSERTFKVRASDGREFSVHEAELNGWDRDLGQYFWEDATYGPNHDKTFLVNEPATL